MKLVDKFERQDKKQHKRIQRLLYLTVIDYLTDRFSYDSNGVIRNNQRNLTTAASLTKIGKRFQREIVNPFLHQVATNLFTKLHEVNARYFNSVVNKSTKAASKVAKDRLKITFGYGKKKLIAGSPILEGGQLDNIWQKIRTDAVNAVSGEVSLKDFRSRIGRYIEGSGSKAGEVERHFHRVTGDIYNQYERKQSSLMATELGLNYFFYQGGLIRSSRDFCEERNGKVFSRDELKLFGTPQDKYGGYTNKSAGEFQGKSTPYNPETDLGGYNCRHRKDWISDEVAFRIRPELRP